MLRVEFDLVGIAPYSQSRPLQTPKAKGESDDAHDSRCWRERMHVNKAGNVCIPPTSVKIALSECAQYMSEKIPGKRNNTYTKHFVSGVLCFDEIDIGVKAADVPGERLYLNADGKRGGSTRVWRTMPHIPAGWTGHVVMFLVDPLLISDPAKVCEYLGHTGTFIGLGRFRPRNGGFYGRFTVNDFKVV